MGINPLKIAYQLRINSLCVFLSLCVSFLIACTNINHKENTLPYYTDASLQAHWATDAGMDINTIHRIQEFSFKDQLGNVYSSDSLKGKIYVANFFFTSCPSICPKMTHNLKRLQDSILLLNNIRILSFSVMPWVDSVSVLSTYAHDKGIDSRYWHLLTGNQKKINSLARNSFFAEKQFGLVKKEDEFMHTEWMFLIDKESRIRGVYNATSSADIERVWSDIKSIEGL